jgi:DNA-binding GntR family transcriptional regulator
MSGARVLVLSQADIEELTEVRCAIEVFAARKLIESSDKAGITTIESRLNDLTSAVESGVWPKIVEADVRFHRSVVEAAANGRLLRFWRDVEGQLLVFLSLHAKDAYRIAELVREHSLLVEAVRSKDHETVARAFEDHIRNRVDLREGGTFVGRRKEGRPTQEIVRARPPRPSARHKPN